MAIKLKSSKGGLWMALLLACCAFVMLGCYDSAQRQAEWETTGETAEDDGSDTEQSWPNYNSDAETNLKSFIRYMCVGSYGMYWELMQKTGQAGISPSGLFLTESGLNEVDTIRFDETFERWYGSFLSLLAEYGVEYRMVSQAEGGVYTNSVVNLEKYETGQKEEDAEEPAFFLKLSYGQDGSLSIAELVNQDGIELGIRDIDGMTKGSFLNWMELGDIHASKLEQPRSVELYLYSNDPMCYYSNRTTLEYEDRKPYLRAAHDTVVPSYLILLAVTALLAWIFPPFWRLRRETRWIARIPAEASLAGGVFGLSAVGLAESLCQDYVYARVRGEDVSLLGLENFVIYLLIYGVWMLSVMVLLQMRDVGLLRFWRERSFVYRNIDRIAAKSRQLARRFVDSVRQVDLGDRSDQWLLRVVAVNFLILSACCLIWFWGVLGLLVYSVLLFFILRKYLNQVKESYGVLLRETRRMAEGDLHMEPTEELGIFAPLGEELAKVNEGFAKAVEEELRSRNLKSELITNVSHDLKTPLTAIITYVNLLKEEQITEEERRNYIEILDRKALRLKKLIEDLFEISKASSGNIRIERQEVDLAEMVRQAVLEQEERLAEAQIDCRVSVPGERVPVWLDGEKTYRILENLLVNVSKYALAGTRAWVSLRMDADAAEIVVKNTSAAELTEDVSYLTERFVRGDKARNTEGSGLGLAIVKSFTELQGGTFGIVTDGDLFKAVVRLPRGEAETGKEEKAEKKEIVPQSQDAR